MSMTYGRHCHVTLYCRLTHGLKGSPKKNAANYGGPDLF